jgi:hypothetical protein
MLNPRQDSATALLALARDGPRIAERPLVQAFFATGCVGVPFRAYAIAQWTAHSTYALNAIAEMTDISA